ncbi:Sjogren's syndrome/scleroderma autoantigen 1 family protein [Candidatus Methanocrinis natronophilus]|uniref:Sjogren's syndrome/scleroderma autoantigen 1 family protein n=1 Tax=Candidatus Methanocrinis natronophilus TaxID=3033396 RepID=A0ABT5X8U0_9EURY|nr:Sjogren's syndrome/scleroderma autoantigen 1 family protein [Candidatus Methanocrinis natronophilus]MDF0591107.1 Sjogren's syndrome/scleroderma autoantigen 1 family protein [Candidatus Methanocrinis natronophilus]
MEEEEAIKRITRLLEMGGTMLANHHDCGAPLFRYKGEVVCPVCSFEEVGSVKAAYNEKRAPFEHREASSPAGRGQISPARRGEASGSSPGARIGYDQPFHPEAGNKGMIGHREGEPMGMAGEEMPDPDLKELKAVILEKIREISGKMRDEQDLGRLKSQIECVKEALEVLERLED